ncbi:MAG: tetratricopeptide repeat protein [Roseibacillus sp.]
MAAITMIEQQLPFADEKASSDWKTIDDRVSKVEAKGEVMEAKRLAASAVQEAREAENGNSKNAGQLLHCLEVRANLFNRQGDFGSAKDDYLEAISLVAGKSGQEGTVGRLYGNLGYLFESTEDEDNAVDAYERALEQLGRLRQPSVVEEVRLSNNLAFIYSARDDFDQAETLFLKALKLAHDKLGASDPDSTGVFNNIGALYQKAGHLEQAKEMHQMALDGRKEDGGSRGDIGQSHGNLAIVFAEEGDEKQARSHFESALSSFQSAGADFSEDFEAVCGNYLQLLANVGDVESKSRVQSLLEKGLK